MLPTRTAAFCSAVLLGSALLTACGGSDSDTTTSPSASSTASAPLTAAQLEKALLGPADYPAGYAVDPTADTSSVEKTGCAEFDALVADTKDQPEASAAYVKGETDPTLIETLTTMADPATEFARGKAAFASCKQLSLDATDPSAPTLDIEPLPIATVGDESFAIKGAGTYQGAPVTIVSAYSRVGSTLVEMDEQAIGAEADAATVTELLKKAVAKVAAAQSAPVA